MAKSTGARTSGGTRPYHLGPLATGLFLVVFGIFWWIALLTVDTRLDFAAAAEASPAGLAGAWLAFLGLTTVGPLAAYTLATLVSLWGVRVVRRNEIADSWLSVVGGLMMAVAVAFLGAASNNRFDLAQGGLLIEYLGPWALAYLGRIGIATLSTLLLGFGAVLALGEFACYLGALLTNGLFAGGRWLAATLFWSGRGAGRGLSAASRAVADGVREGWHLPVTVRRPPESSDTLASDNRAERQATPASRLPVPVNRVRTEPEETAARPTATRRPRRQVIVEIEEVEKSDAAVVERPSPRETLAEEDVVVPEKSEAARGLFERMKDITRKIREVAALEDPGDWSDSNISTSRSAPSPDSTVFTPAPETADPSSTPENEDEEILPSARRPAPAPRRPKPEPVTAPPAPEENGEGETDGETEPPPRRPAREAASRFATRETLSDELPEPDEPPRRAAAPQARSASIPTPTPSREPPRAVVQPSGDTAPEEDKPSPSDYYDIDEIDESAPPPPRPAVAARPAPASAAKIDRIEVKPIEFNEANYELPTLTLLDAPPPPVAHNRLALEKRARILEQTLSEFKIDGRVVHIERGPRVTLYEISLAPGIKLNRVTGLADNVAMMLRAASVRIIAPIPGKDTIGIEIPNLEKETVSLREIVETINRHKRSQALPICLGKDVSGQPLVADLARMPHLLIAGATGSGKSVCINSVILSLMTCCRPDEAKLIMVDPKVVELSRFRDIPHLMCPVITDMKRAVAVLDWVCQKMDERYEQMALVGVNNIAKFNALGAEAIARRLSGVYDDDELELFPKSMPYIVLIIDELADLMMVAGKEVEHHITRLAAKSRAVGIHLLLATQRPSVNVITGLIKANMPCRIAFQVASKVDSRTILDQNGAETLLGQGDMLYLPPGVGKLTRAQGVFVSDEELFRVVDAAKAQARPQFHADLEGPVIGGGSDVDLADLDELFYKSGEAIIESGRGSVSLLQRKLGIGYGRASRIIDQLASAGVLGPFRDGKAREILMTLDEFTAKYAGEAGKIAARRLTLDDDDNSFAGLRTDERAPSPGVPWDDED